MGKSPGFADAVRPASTSPFIPEFPFFPHLRPPNRRIAHAVPCLPNITHIGRASSSDPLVRIALEIGGSVGVNSRIEDHGVPPFFPFGDLARTHSRASPWPVLCGASSTWLPLAFHISRGGRSWPARPPLPGFVWRPPGIGGPESPAACTFGLVGPRARKFCTRWQRHRSARSGGSDVAPNSGAPMTPPKPRPSRRPLFFFCAGQGAFRGVRLCRLPRPNFQDGYVPLVAELHILPRRDGSSNRQFLGHHFSLSLAKVSDFPRPGEPATPDL